MIIDNIRSRQAVCVAKNGLRATGRDGGVGLGMRTEETFALIIGGGPVGLAAALELGWRGIPAILVTENMTTATHPRCNTTNARSMEHFRRLGIADEVRAAAPLAETLPHAAYATRFCGREFARIDLTRARAGTGTAAPGQALLSSEGSVTISQLFLEPVLKRAAERHSSVSLRFGWRALDVAEHADGVTVRVQKVGEDEVVEIAARYLVAADGARSLARKVIGATMEGERAAMDGQGTFVSGAMLTYFVRAPTLLAESGRRPAVLTWIINHDLKAFVFAQDGKERWIVHCQVPDGAKWQDVDHAAMLQAVFGRGVPYEVINFGPWTGGLALNADQYQSRRIFLAGDAAHLFTPLGGFGMNTGIGDAVNLGWKLAAVHDGWGAEGLLASYGAERRPIGLRNTGLGVKCSKRKGSWVVPPGIEEDGEAAEQDRRAFGAFVEADDLEEFATVGLQLGEAYEGSPVVWTDGSPAPPDSWSTYQPRDRPGARAPDFRTGDGAMFHDKLGKTFVLAHLGGGNAPGAWAAAARERGMPLSLVAAAPPAGLYSSSLVLIRPDHHIAWHGGDAPVDPGAVLDMARGAATAP